MKKGVLVSIIGLLVLAFEACSNKSSSPIEIQPGGSVRQVPGCVSHGLSKSSATDSSFNYEFNDILVMNFLLPDNCTSDSIRFAVSQRISNDTIYVTAVDTATVNARCPCTYLVHAELEGLQRDGYFILCTRIDDGVETVVCAQYVYRQGSGNQGETVIYSNSFESSADTVGWTGYGSMQFNSDVPPGGGKQSLFVSGACLVPHAAYRIGKAMVAGRFVLRFWGKNLGVGGGVGLGFAPSPASGIGVSVRDSAWTFYESGDTLDCPADSTLWLNMAAGGIIPSAMLVDNVEVVRIG